MASSQIAPAAQPPCLLDARLEHWTNATPLRISGKVLESVSVAVARISQGALYGEGEAAGVYYHGDSGESLVPAVRALESSIKAGLDRAALQILLPAGGVRNALDCALWALESRRDRVPAWRLAGLPTTRPLLTTFTIGAEAPGVCGERAAGWIAKGAKALKLKLCGDGTDVERVAAVRREAPNAWLGVDANQGWTLELLQSTAPRLADLGVALIEQPLPVGQDEALAGWSSPIALAADESFQDRNDLERLAKLYQVFNIKLDKTGGLTEALACVRAGRRLGLKMMVGNMGGTSLAMAPAFVVGQYCEIVDLDGPIYFIEDREPPVQYIDGLIQRPRGWDWDADEAERA